MPNVNLTDSRSRDAVVKAETTGVDEEVRYVDDSGQSAYTRKILKATVEHDFETLVKKYDGDAESLGKALVEDDPEVDMEICGLYLWGVSKVYVDSSDGIVYRIEQQEIVRGPDGSVREKRPRNRPEANVDSEIPLTWTGRKIDKDDAVRRFVFASKLQIVHINGLTYDFLYGMAKELAESNALMMVGGGSKGRDPLVFRRGSVPYRGFLEGRIDGDKYLLLLHLSNLELKVPSAEKIISKDEKSNEVKEESVEKKSSGKKASDKEKKDSKKVEEVEQEAKTEQEVATRKTATKKKVSKKKVAKKSSSKSGAMDDAEAANKLTDKPDTDKASKKKVKQESKDEPQEKKAVEKSSPDSDTNKDDVDSNPATVRITSDDLGVWLKSIRMGKYLQLFIDNEIDVDVLTELTDADLKELDIPLGSRRRLLKAVEETDNLHAEVAMAVSQMTGTAVGKAAKQKK